METQPSVLAVAQLHMPVDICVSLVTQCMHTPCAYCDTVSCVETLPKMKQVLEVDRVSAKHAMPSWLSCKQASSA